MIKALGPLMLSVLLCGACDHASQSTHPGTPASANHDEPVEAAPRFASSQVAPAALATRERTLPTVRIQLDSELLCDPCTEFITETLGKEAGVASVNVDQKTGLVTVTYRAEIDKKGFESKVRRLPQYAASAAPTIGWQ